ncbi:unnamed protein product [Calicophoron daubneyi]|uniref:Uncharacterized protein n=1 Tax=Calicophoron daubneyi TaxID=300641 RepID=A0AAV2U127_CALDB
MGPSIFVKDYRISIPFFLRLHPRCHWHTVSPFLYPCTLSIATKIALIVLCLLSFDGPVNSTFSVRVCLRLWCTVFYPPSSHFYSSLSLTHHPCDLYISPDSPPICVSHLC